MILLLDQEREGGDAEAGGEGAVPAGADSCTEGAVHSLQAGAPGLSHPRPRDRGTPQERADGQVSLHASFFYCLLRNAKKLYIFKHFAKSRRAACIGVPSIVRRHMTEHRS